MPDAIEIPFGPSERSNASALIDLALDEDLGQSGDLTANLTIPPRAMGSALFVSRSNGTISGLPVAEMLAARFDLEMKWQASARDGDLIAPGSVVARVAGPLRPLLAMERTALNFLQRPSGGGKLT